MLDSAIPGVSSLVIHISDPGPWGLHNQPDNNSNDLTQIINILLHNAAVNTAHWPATLLWENSLISPSPLFRKV